MFNNTLSVEDYNADKSDWSKSFLTWFPVGIRWDNILSRPIVVGFNGCEPLRAPITDDHRNDDLLMSGYIAHNLTGIKETLINSGYSGTVLLDLWCGEGAVGNCCKTKRLPNFHKGSLVEDEAETFTTTVETLLAIIDEALAFTKTL
jgi:hypothetical protein